MQYVLDTNVMIEAYQRYYAFDLAPKFWGELHSRFSSGDIGSIDKVRAEILRMNDDLSAWVTSRPVAFVSSGDSDIIAEYSRIISWTMAHGQYTQTAKEELARVADGWVVAYAKAKGCTVTTMEVSEPNIKKRVKIPEICNQFSVPFLNTYDMLRRLGVQFV